MTEAELSSDGKRFQIDHFQPMSKFPELKRTYDNLIYACEDCNHFKRDKWPTADLIRKGLWFAHPAMEDSDRHWAATTDFFLAAFTKSGDYTIVNVALNRPYLVHKRRERHQIHQRYMDRRARKVSALQNNQRALSVARKKGVTMMEEELAGIAERLTAKIELLDSEYRRLWQPAPDATN